jgi:peptide/nickel transport system substrate-binding protein
VTDTPEVQPGETEDSAMSTDEPMEQPTEEEVDEPVLLRVGGLIDADCWNPFTCEFVYVAGNLVLEGLTGTGPASEGCPGVPRIAETWEASNDGRTWTITLHEGITYSDGTPLTANTIKEYMEWFNSMEAIAPFFPETLYLESVEVIDDLTLRMNLALPVLSGPDLSWLTMFILPPHIWAELDESELFTYDFYPPIGTGPYVFTEHVPGAQIIFDARENYYRGKPPIDRIIYQLYTNMDSLTQALIAGDIDLTSIWLPPESVEILAQHSNITVEEKYPGDTYDLTFNVGAGGLSHPAIRDPAVRRAIDYAIDKQQIVDVVFLGKGITCPTNWGCGPNFEGELNPDLVVTPYDPEEANQILEEEGYIDTDGDGIRETPDGLPLEFRLYYPTEWPLIVTISDLVAAWLGQIGIKVNIEGQEYGTWLNSITIERDYDLSINTRFPDFDAGGMDFWFSCWAAELGFNYSGYCNEEKDDLVYEYLNAPDFESRWEPMFKAQEMLNQDRPIIILAGPLQIQAYRNDRFEFPLDTCYCCQGMYDPPGLFGAVPK